MNKQDVFECRNWRNGTCPRSDAIILEERSDHIQMGCRTCRGGWIVTLPEGVKKARYENRITAIKEAQAHERLDRHAVSFGSAGVYGSNKP